jgi:ABC-type branched-subunit amino acid transport system substrate-binding protein
MRAHAPKIDRSLRRAAVAAVLALALGACAGQQRSAVSAPPAPTGPVAYAGASPQVDMTRPAPVALLAPLSGSDSADQAAAADVEAAARLAAAEARGAGIDLRVYDTGGSAAGAADAARRAIAEGAAILIGPFYRATTDAVRPAAESAGTPVLSFSSDIAVAGAPIWVLGDLPGREVDRIVAYAASQGIGSLAVIYPQTEYGQLVNRETARAAARQGVAVVSTLPYPRSFEGVQAATEAGAPDILASGATGAVLADGGPALRAVGAFLAYHDVLQPQVRYLGLSQWNTRDTLAEAPLRGGWFAAADPAAEADFAARFQAATGRAPHPRAGFGYDAVRAVDAMLAAARAAGTDRPFTPQAITAPQGFRGARGAFRLTPEGGNSRALAVMEVGDGEFIVRDPAPAVAPAGS